MLITTTADGSIISATEKLREGLNLRGTVRGLVDPQTLEVNPLPSGEIDWTGASDRESAYLHGDAALWRVENGRLRYAVADLASVKDVFYAPSDNGGWHFSDDFMELARLIDICTIDTEEVIFFVRHGYFRRGATYFRQIRRVPVSQRVVPSSKGLLFESLFEDVYAETQNQPRTYEGFKRVLESVCRAEKPDARDAVLLSGGWDSALLAAQIRRLTSAPFHSATFWYRPAKDHNLMEVRCARRIADQLGIRHHAIPVDFNTIAPEMLDGLIDRMPLAAHLGFNFLEGTRSLPSAGIERAWSGMGADARYNLGPTSRLAPGQGKIDLVKRWFLSKPFFESLPDVNGRATLAARLATACGLGFARRHYKNRGFRAPANVNELLFAYVEGESYLALMPRDPALKRPALARPVSARAVRRLLCDELHSTAFIGCDGRIAHYAPAMQGLDPIRPFAAPSMVLYFRALNPTWRDVWSPKRFIRDYLRELIGTLNFRILCGSQTYRLMFVGKTSADWGREILRTRALRDINAVVAGLPEPWISLARQNKLQNHISLYWFAKTMRKLGRSITDDNG